VRLPILVDTHLVSFARRQGWPVTDVVADAVVLYLGLLDEPEEVAHAG